MASLLILFIFQLLEFEVNEALSFSLKILSPCLESKEVENNAIH